MVLLSAKTSLSFRTPGLRLPCCLPSAHYGAAQSVESQRREKQESKNKKNPCAHTEGRAVIKDRVIRPYSFSGSNGGPQYSKGQPSIVWEEFRGSGPYGTSQQEHRPAQSKGHLYHQESSRHLAPSQPPVHEFAGSGAECLSLEDAEEGSHVEASLPSPTLEKLKHMPVDVCAVTTIQQAKEVLEKMEAYQQHAEETGTLLYWACDTEVADIDVKQESPVGHGAVICISIYCGPHHDFTLSGEASRGPSSCKQTKIWIDLLPSDVKDVSVKGILEHPECKGIIEVFKPYFESDRFKKVWHNYGFDRHVLMNMGIDCQGFEGDTIHMARLYDASRKGKDNYSLESLSRDEAVMKPRRALVASPRPSWLLEELPSKRGMKERFGYHPLKRDGTPGKLITVDPVEKLQLDPETRYEWIDYSALDAQATWHLHAALKCHLMERYAQAEAKLFGKCTEGLWRTKCERENKSVNQKRTGIDWYTMWDLYMDVLKPFGKLLTDMEREGIMVNRAHLKEGEERAIEDSGKATQTFLNWAKEEMGEDARFMNVNSGTQIRHLFFPSKVGSAKMFKALNPEYDPTDKKKGKKWIDFVLHGIYNNNKKDGEVPDRELEVEEETAKGLPAVGQVVLRKLAGRPGAAKKALQTWKEDDISNFEDDDMAGVRPGEDGEINDEGDEEDTEKAKTTTRSKKSKKSRLVIEEQLEKEAAANGWGRLYTALGGGQRGLRACEAVESLCDLSTIEKLTTAFLQPLQSDRISTPDHRVHCSLNLNTETGRLSARRPNLQNQPALEKDRYQVRKAFTADISKGNTLVVADYGQLELRILAHMARCKSMIQAFELGGDFHSRTALGMYDHVKKAVEKGDCLLEWDSHGEAPAPLLKDMFGSERRKAKVLNFSIAYGKTAHGLSRDWGVSLQEAQETVDRWYADRPEVLDWQKKTKRFATREGYVSTLLGRRRRLPGAKSMNRSILNAALRAAINTPIQGSAADVAMSAMIAIDENEELRDLGYKLLLQIHDEVILEGPKQHAGRARELVIECMGNPWKKYGVEGQPLEVELVVDCKHADTWYEAK